MKFGVVGLGRMGNAIAYRARNAGYDVYGFDLDETSRAAAADIGVRSDDSLQAIAGHADVIWLMVPAGKAVDSVLEQLVPCLRQGALIVDGGNSHYVDSVRRAAQLRQSGVSFLDCGTSGGLHGREIGFSLMVGGDRAAYDTLVPLLHALAAPGGCGYVGPSGAGHYVKMVHNGIEYGLMQAYAEGFQLLKEGSYKDNNLDLAAISGIWNHGAIIRSWLLELSHTIFEHDQQLSSVSGVIQESGTGRWTVEDAHKNNIPVPVIEQALNVRADSRKTGGNYATKVVALLRNAFGGHAVGTLSKPEGKK